MVYHVLKDGSVTEDISDHVVKMEDAKNLYGLMDSINTSGSRKRKEKEKLHN